MTKRELHLLTAVWFLWLGGLQLASMMASLFFEYAPSFPYAFSLLAPSELPRWLYSWAGFDGVHYLTIAEKGYKGTGLIQAFFPVFPLIIRVVTLVLPLVLSGIVVGILTSLVLVITWFFFCKHFFSSKFAWLATGVLLLFPSSFFFVAVYTESLFLILVLWSFYFLDRRKWGLVMAMSAIATATRVTGVFLVPALILAVLLWDESWQGLLQRLQLNKIVLWTVRQLRSYWLQIFLLIFGYTGLWLYMGYLSQEFQDPLYFYHVQSEFGSGREERIILWPQVVWRYIKILLTQSSITWQLWSIIQEALVGVFGLVILLSSFKWIRPSWVLFALGAFILPTLTGTFSSMPRYVLVCFPLFLVLTQLLLHYPRWRWLYFVISGMLLIINTMLFIQGYWVA